MAGRYPVGAAGAMFLWACERKGMDENDKFLHRS
jgi:hypothetical protein